MIRAAHRANGATAADLQAQRGRSGQRLTTWQGNQQLDSVWRVLAEHLNAFNAWGDEVARRIEQIAAMGRRHEQWHSEHVDEIHALRRRVTALEAGRDSRDEEAA